MKAYAFELRRRAFIAAAFLLLFVLFACSPRTSSEAQGNTTMMINQNTAREIVYVAVGDSTGVGVGAEEGGYPARLLKRIRQEHEDARLVNLCVSGATTDDLLREQLAEAISSRPTLITVAIGINDLGNNFTVEKFARNFEEIIKRLKAGTKAAIVVSNLPDISFAPVVPADMRAGTRSQINRFNERIREIAARHSLALVDAYAETHAIIPEHPEFFSEDGFHPSDAGYEYWAKMMWPAVKAVLGQ